MSRREPFTVPPADKLLASILARTRAAEGGCLLWTGSVNGTGYPKIFIPGRLLGRRWHTRTWLYARMRGAEVPLGHVVTTRCGNPRCIAPDHLLARLRSAHMKRCVPSKPADTRMRMARAQRLKSRLTIEIVREIRRRRAEGALLTDISRDYGIDQSYASRICRHKLWRDFATPFMV